MTSAKKDVAAPPKTVIALGEATYKIAPLTLQQLVDLRVVAIDNPPPTFSDPDNSPGDNLRALFQHRMTVVAEGISAVTGQHLTAADIGALHATDADLTAAYVAVIELAGLRLVPQKGEAKPAA